MGVFSHACFTTCRAHAVFTITVEQKERQSSKVGVRCNISLVELAGQCWLVKAKFISSNTEIFKLLLL